jgi:MFS family permease
VANHPASRPTYHAAMTRTHAQDADAIDLPWVIGLSVAQLISWGSVFYGFSLFMSPIEEALALSRAESSLAFSLALLMEGLCAFHVGRWIDRGHERAVMTVGSLLLALGFIAQAFITQGWQFYAVWTVLGVGLSATLYPPAFAVLTRRFPTHFRRAIILLTFLGGLASTVFIPLIAGCMQATDWATTSWVLGWLHLLVCAPLHFHLLRNAPPARVVEATKHARVSAEGSLQQHVRNPTFGLMAVFMVLLMAVTAALPAHMINLLRESGLQEAWVLALPAIIGVLQVGGRAGLFVAEHRLDVHRVNRWVPCLIPLGFALLCVGGTHGALALLFVLTYGLGNGMFTIVKGTVVAQYVSQTHVGSLNGLMGLPMALARAAAPWFMGMMWQPEAGYQRGLLWMLALSCLGVAALWAAQRRALIRGGH